MILIYLNHHFNQQKYTYKFICNGCFQFPVSYWHSVYGKGFYDSCWLGAICWLQIYWAITGLFYYCWLLQLHLLVLIVFSSMGLFHSKLCNVLGWKLWNLHFFSNGWTKKTVECEDEHDYASTNWLYCIHRLHYARCTMHRFDCSVCVQETTTLNST